MDDFIKLYNIGAEDERYFYGLFYKHVSFYQGVLCALISGIILLVYKIDDNHQLRGFILMLGGSIMVIVSYFAKVSTNRIYRRTLEAIVLRANLEKKCHLTNISKNENINNTIEWNGTQEKMDKNMKNSNKYLFLFRFCFLLFVPALFITCLVIYDGTDGTVMIGSLIVLLTIIISACVFDHISYNYYQSAGELADNVDEIYWGNEPLIPKSQVIYRKLFHSSREFINDTSERAEEKASILALYYIVFIIGVGMLISGLNMII